MRGLGLEGALISTEYPWDLLNERADHFYCRIGR
jgi:hypothetical protein